MEIEFRHDVSRDGGCICVWTTNERNRAAILSSVSEREFNEKPYDTLRKMQDGNVATLLLQEAGMMRRMFNG